MRHTVLPNAHCLPHRLRPTHLVWKISVKSCSRKSTREVSLRISFTYTCTTTESGPFSYESFLTNARFTMDSGSTLRPQLSATSSRFLSVTIPLPDRPPIAQPDLGLYLPTPSPIFTIHQGHSVCCQCHLLFGTVTFLRVSAPGHGWRDWVIPGGHCLLSCQKCSILLRARKAGLGVQQWYPELFLSLSLFTASLWA